MADSYQPDVPQPEQPDRRPDQPPPESGLAPVDPYNPPKHPKPPAGAVPPVQYAPSGQPVMPEQAPNGSDAGTSPLSQSPRLRPRNILKAAAMVFAVFFVLIVGYFGGQYVAGRKPAPAPPTTEDSFPQPDQSPGIGKDKTSTVSCTSETGPDATTTSQKFVDIEGTNCTYRSGPNPETLVLSGKLTGRNTDGTGMSVTINVNDKDCTGGETLNYSKNWTPMFSSCTFNVSANSVVKIKWRFLSPFSGTAAVLRSSTNIAPFITGVAVPR